MNINEPTLRDDVRKILAILEERNPTLRAQIKCGGVSLEDFVELAIVMHQGFNGLRQNTVVKTEGDKNRNLP